MHPDNPRTIAGYALLDDGVPIPGGVAYASAHPIRRTPVVLRCYRADWLLPADSLDNFHDRARAAVGLDHPNLCTPLETGFVGSEVFAVLPRTEGMSLHDLVRGIGQLPLGIACEFVRQAALGLQAAHDRGLVHGDVSPSRVQVWPLEESNESWPEGAPMRVPTADAAAVLHELGLVPRRPGGREWAVYDPLSVTAIAYLPPERMEDGTPTVAGDVYGLGAMLYFLLSGRPPFAADSAADLVHAIAYGEAPPLESRRPDLPADVAEFVRSMMARDAASRPASAGAVAAELQRLTAPPVPLAPAAPEIVTMQHASESSSENVFEQAQRAAGAKANGQAPLTAADRARLKIWLVLGGIFWLVLAPILWFVLLSENGCFGKPANNPTPKSRR